MSAHEGVFGETFPFQLLETLRLENGRLQNWEAHLKRLLASAAYFGFSRNADAIDQAAQAIARGHAHGTWRLRLLLAVDGRIDTETQLFEPTAGPVVVRLAQSPIDALSLEFLQHKTTFRPHYDRFADPDAFDSLLWNDRGFVTEFTRGNVLVKLDGRWITPPLEAGLLPGVGRARLLNEGQVVEAPFHKDDLSRIEKLVFVNSLRGQLTATLRY